MTHIAPDTDGKIIGEPVTQRGVINYPVKSLGLCASITDAPYVTTTEVSFILFRVSFYLHMGNWYDGVFCHRCTRIRRVAPTTNATKRRWRAWSPR